MQPETSLSQTGRTATNLESITYELGYTLGYR